MFLIGNMHPRSRGDHASTDIIYPPILGRFSTDGNAIFHGYSRGQLFILGSDALVFVLAVEDIREVRSKT